MRKLLIYGVRKKMGMKKYSERIWEIKGFLYKIVVRDGEVVFVADLGKAN
jgi:hypothetical protein